jgi:hypothetical protein
MNDRRGAYSVLVCRHIRKIKLGRPKGRWEGNNKVDIQEMRWRT